MTPEEMVEDATYRLQHVIDDIVKSRLATLSEPGSEELVELVLRSSVLQKGISDHFERHVATTVGNRLRCGMYPDSSALDVIFDSIWTEQWDRAIADRIRGKVDEILNKMISDRLKKLL